MHPFVLISLLPLALAATNKTGFSGTLSSLDGGLGGTVTVVDPTTLAVANFALEDSSAPALYWWGSATPQLRDGFRISNKQVTEKGDGTKTYTIMMDAGKTVDDFGTVGLWCERFGVNFGQTELKSPVGGGAGGSGTGSTGGRNGESGSGMTSEADTGMRIGRMTVGLAAVGMALLLV